MPSTHSSRLLGPTTLQTMPIGFIRDTLPSADRPDASVRPARSLRRRADQRVHPIAPSAVRRVRSREPEARDDALLELSQRARPRVVEPSPVATDGPARKRSRRPAILSHSTSAPVASGSSAAYARAERSLAKATARRENESRESRTMALARAPTRLATTDYAEERVVLQKGAVKALTRGKRILAQNGEDCGSEEDDPEQSGVVAADEFEHMKKEIIRLKEELSGAKETMGKQAKTIHNLEKEKAEQSTQVTKLKSKVAKSDEILATFESNLQCLICLDPLLKPYALAPCGHIYCLSCLQDWFRSAPPADEDMYDSDTVHALIHRRKTCPSCRGYVRARPAPVFLVKALAVALSARDGASPPAPSLTVTPPAEGGNTAAPAVEGAEGDASPAAPADPWADIFYPERGPDDVSSDSDSSGIYDDDDDDDDQFAVSEEEDVVGTWGAEYGYGTGSEEEPDDGPYVMRSWEPPSVLLEAADPPRLAGEERSLLSRGATMGMLAAFGMGYTRQGGISIRRDDTTFFPGWNISLHPADADGAEYVEWLARDLADRPERWDVQRGPRGRMLARRLVRRGEVEEYDTTDSEAY